MQYTGINKLGAGLDLKMPSAFLGSIQDHIGVFTTRRKHKAPTEVVRGDWYPMNTAAKAQGDFWARLLLP